MAARAPYTQDETMSANPDDLASVTAANRDRLMGVAAAIRKILERASK